MSEKVYDYPGDEIVVRYSMKRCIHAAECANGLPEVFNPEAKPWVNPDATTADAVAEVIHRCPTGALKYERKDGGAEESTPESNTITVAPDGPLYVRGDIEIKTSDGNTMLKDTRVALCRCGASKNKPFCDNSHLKSGFADPAQLGTGGATSKDAELTALRVVLAGNGPLLFEGPVEVTGAGEPSRSFSKAALCRCGASENKPFCDGTHRRIGFTDA